MRRHTSILAATALATVLGIVSVPDTGSAQITPIPPRRIYNPYPLGILPGDLPSEIARVQREITGIFNQGLSEMAILFTNPPTLTGNPPTLQGTGYQAIHTLGKLMNFDLNISPFQNEACASCHMPYAGFSGPIPSVNLTMIAYPGTLQFRAGKRTA
jgi:cytochrome c peroxidase